MSKKIAVILLALVLSTVYLPRLSAQEDAAGNVIDMIVGDIQSVPVSDLSRVSVTDPDVADVSDAEANQVSLVAKKAGQTVLFLWDANGKRSIQIRVSAEDLDTLMARIQKILQEANINGVSLEVNHDISKVVLTGAVSKDDKYRLGDILQPYSDGLLNLVREEKSEDLIQVDMQIVEIQTSLEKNLGILWGTESNANTGSNGTSSGTATNLNSGQVNLNYNETIPSQNGKIGDFFKIGNFYRTSPLEATVNALIQEGKARLISKPRLVVESGKQASFLVGGEIPVESTTVSTTGSTLTSNTTYAQYGVNLAVTPTIREGKIDILLNVDIRDIDASNSSNGNTAFITRTATTNLFMDNRQTIALAGLIKYTDSEQVTEVPFLSKIPILGALFRNRSTPSPDTNTEMVIILTPTVMTDKKFATNQLVMPTPVERDSWNEINSKYEHEPIGPQPPVVVTPAAEDSPNTNASFDTTGLSATMAYARMVQEKISKAITYPSQVGGNVTSGTVRLKLRILRNGTLDSEDVIESSGNTDLDQDALQAAKTAAPYAAFTEGMDQQDLVFTIPIVYNRLISATSSTEKVVAPY